MIRNTLLRLMPLVLFSSLFANAATPFHPTTTLAAETGNNTSAAVGFTGQSNGNIAGANISKMPLRTLLYPGSTSKIYAHFVPWFGFGDHVNVGYTSNDAAQVQKQVDDMVSRGLDGAVIDWYGQGTFNKNFVSYDQASQLLMQNAEAHPGFSFAIMHDAVSLKPCASTAGCDVTQTLIDDLNYANRTYQNSPAYMHYNGRPVFYFFGHESLTIDWARVRAGVAGNPIFVFRNPSGFSRPQSEGGFSWVEPTTSGMTYLDGFYSAALSVPTMYMTGSGYKGFDDSIAAWTQHRLTPQSCGQTWLASVAEAGKYYNSSNQMLGIQLVTWNDYEEGTEFETGIDNCVSVSASVSGNTLSWSISGQMNTVDHFTVFASQDGQNLMFLADQPTTAKTLDLSQFGLPAGNYTIFVKAVGKPSLTNKMSPGVGYTAGSTTTAPVVMLSVTPVSGNVPLIVTADTAGSTAPGGTIASITIDFGDGSAIVNAANATHTYSAAGNYTVTATVTDNHGTSANKTATVTAGSASGNLTLTVPPGANATTVKAGQTATFSLQLAATGAPFSVTVTCTGAPNAAACNGPASPISVTPGSTTNVAINVSTAARATVLPAPIATMKTPPALWLLPATSMLVWFLSGSAWLRAAKQIFAGFAVKTWKPVLAAPLLLMAMAGVGCGSRGATPTPSTNQGAGGTPAGTYTLVVTATSGSISRTTQLTLTVQ